MAAWFVDTNYNQESFFIRHAYFTGAGEPFKQLLRFVRSVAVEHPDGAKPFDGLDLRGPPASA